MLPHLSHPPLYPPSLIIVQVLGNSFQCEYVNDDVMSTVDLSDFFLHTFFFFLFLGINITLLLLSA